MKNKTNVQTSKTTLEISTIKTSIKHFAVVASVCSISYLFSGTAQSEDQVSVSHYFTGELGKAGITEIFDQFNQHSGIKVIDSPIGHEDFKTGILVRSAGGNLPDVFSYWAGAKTQFVADADALHPIDDMWAANKLDSVVAKSVADGATTYNEHRFLVPFGYHYAGMFYNTKVLAENSIDQLNTWDDLLGACKTLRAKDINPIALGSKNRWPAQFWFDYLILRTAGPDFRAELMAGTQSYDGPEVKAAMALWSDLIDAECFNKNANAYTWTDASDQVAKGEAAMTLMGTWITGYWNENKLKPVDDYDFFEFPTIKEGVANAVVGPVDGLVIAKNSENIEAAEKLLSFLVTDTTVQAKWAKVQGALSPNVNVDESIYTPVMQKALATISKADAFAFNYDLATTPPVAEVGLSMFTRFIDDPSQVDSILSETQQEAKEAFDAQ